MTVDGDAEAAFITLVAAFDSEPGIATGTSFGTNPGLRIDGKIFVILRDEELVLKLPADLCRERVAAGAAHYFEVGGRTMREWVCVPSTFADEWIGLARDALEFVRPA